MAADPEPRNTSGPGWLAGLLLGVVAVVLSLAFLVSVINGLDDDDDNFPVIPAEGTPGQAGTSTATRSPKDQLKVFGPLPNTPAVEAMLPADANGADIVFELSDSPDAIPGRWWIAVADPAAALDAITLEQAKGLAAGTYTNWSEVGGRDIPVSFAVAGPAADQARVRALLGLPPNTGGTSFDSYELLRSAMVTEPGKFALVPLSEVRPTMQSLAIDGVDIVRGAGDPDAYPFLDRLVVSGRTDRGKNYLKQNLAALAVSPPQPITIVATGDVLMSRCTLAQIEATGDWAAPLRGPVGEYLAAADLALTSLDASIQDIGEPYRCVETTNLTSPAEVLEALTIAGIDEATVATNHVFDCGQDFCGIDGFLRMLELVSGAGIKIVGGGRNLEEALAPAIFEVQGVKFGILGFDDIAAMDLEATDTEPGTAPLDDDYSEERAAGEPAFYRPASELSLTRFTQRITALKQEVDVVIVQVQTGTEDTHTPTERSIKALRAAADAGADLVVGNQAHWVQAAEFRGNTFIPYALGNFIFDQRHQPEHYQGVLLEATFHGPRLVAVKFLPYEIVDQMKPTFVDGEVARKILDDIWTASEDLPR